jgi:prepilin-type N-terminal cleavage/methylation domain-containing protein
MKKYFKKGIKGFTLIELMIVIAIIAILAAILIPNFIRAREEAQYSACESNEKNIATAVSMYSTDYNGDYPDLGAAGSAFNTLSEMTPSYLQNFPSCPTNGAQYNYYESTSNGQGFTIDQGGSTNVHGTPTPSLPGGGSGSSIDCALPPCYGSGVGLLN